MIIIFLINLDVLQCVVKVNYTILVRWSKKLKKFIVMLGNKIIHIQESEDREEQLFWGRNKSYKIEKNLLLFIITIIDQKLWI